MVEVVVNGVRHLMQEPDAEHQEAHSHLTLCGETWTSWRERDGPDAEWCLNCLAARGSVEVVPEDVPADPRESLVDAAGNITVSPDGESVAMTSDQGYSAEELQEMLSESSDPMAFLERLGFSTQGLDITQGRAEEPRVATTRDLVAITNAATRLGLNRRLNRHSFSEGPPVLHRLKRNAYHTLGPMLVHRHADGEEVEPHLRVRAMLHFEGAARTRPHQRMMDVPFDLYRRLPTIEEMYERDPDARASRERAEQWKRNVVTMQRKMAKQGQKRKRGG